MTVPLARDTSPDIEQIQIARWRRMSPAEKAALITGLTGAAFEMARAGISREVARSGLQGGRIVIGRFASGSP